MSIPSSVTVLRAQKAGLRMLQMLLGCGSHIAISLYVLLPPLHRASTALKAFSNLCGSTPPVSEVPVCPPCSHSTLVFPQVSLFLYQTRLLQMGNGAHIL
jgi:hypothetical protein